MADVPLKALLCDQAEVEEKPLRVGVVWDQIDGCVRVMLWEIGVQLVMSPQEALALSEKVRDAVPEHRQ